MYLLLHSRPILSRLAPGNLQSPQRVIYTPLGFFFSPQTRSDGSNLSRTETGNEPSAVQAGRQSGLTVSVRNRRPFTISSIRPNTKRQLEDWLIRALKTRDPFYDLHDLSTISIAGIFCLLIFFFQPFYRQYYFVLGAMKFYASVHRRC